MLGWGYANEMGRFLVRYGIIAALIGLSFGFAAGIVATRRECAHAALRAAGFEPDEYDGGVWKNRMYDQVNLDVLLNTQGATE